MISSFSSWTKPSWLSIQIAPQLVEALQRCPTIAALLAQQPILPGPALRAERVTEKTLMTETANAPLWTWCFCLCAVCHRHHLGPIC